ncbi:MAG TPA: hypothetical protein VFR53_04090 [Methylomirabilota bacterium]|jgi:uncharacterized membrane protein (DUF106 family)|nr:hypothetical protein [Methylomirabilota bacterium]
MRTLIGWAVGAACATVIVSGVTALPVQGHQDVKHERKDVEASRQKLREAYKSGDPAAIKTARENYQKARNDSPKDKRERRTNAPDPK